MSAQRVPYTRDESVAGSFDQILDRTVDALAEEGFGVMWDVDAQATFEEKLGKGFRNYVILGACAPDLAYEALGHEARLGALLPCNVVVQESGPDRIEVSAVAPETLLGLVGNPALDPIIEEVGERLDLALDAVLEG